METQFIKEKKSSVRLKMEKEYNYLGDRLTDPCLVGQQCRAILRENGKCIRSKNGSMLVSFNGKVVIVLARRLRKIK